MDTDNTELCFMAEDSGEEFDDEGLRAEQNLWNRLEYPRDLGVETIVTCLFKDGVKLETLGKDMIILDAAVQALFQVKQEKYPGYRAGLLEKIVQLHSDKTLEIATAELRLSPSMMDQDFDPDSDMLDPGSPSSSQNSIPHSLSPANHRVLFFIDKTFQGVITALAARPPTEVKVELERISKGHKQQPISLKDNRGLALGSTGDENVITTRSRMTSRTIKYTWPGKTQEEAWRFACLLAILAEIKTAVASGVTVTKRDIYYHQPELFKKQETVDRFIDDIAFTCGITRRDLRVTASPKGLFCGLPESDSVQIVPGEYDLLPVTAIQQIKWILVVEKEASLKTLVEHDFHSRCSSGAGLLVTGKGYPDLSTKQFLRHVLDIHPFRPPIFGLFDGDPDGLEILRCYRFGSKQQVQEARSNVPEMIWLGVDLTVLLSQRDVMDAAIPMTTRDRSRARSMLGRMAGGSCDTAKIVYMLQMMMMLDRKMEIQALGRLPGGLCQWLDVKISSRR